MDFFSEKLPGAQALFSKSGLFFDFLDLKILPKALAQIRLFGLFCKKNFFFWENRILVPAREFFLKKKGHYAKCPHTLKSVFSIFFSFFSKSHPSDGFFLDFVTLRPLVPPTKSTFSLFYSLVRGIPYFFSVFLRVSVRRLFGLQGQTACGPKLAKKHWKNRGYP